MTFSWFPSRPWRHDTWLRTSLNGHHRNSRLSINAGTTWSDNKLSFNMIVGRRTVINTVLISKYSLLVQLYRNFLTCHWNQQYSVFFDASPSLKVVRDITHNARTCITRTCITRTWTSTCTLPCILPYSTLFYPILQNRSH